MEKLGINVYQLLAQVVNVLILLFILKKFLLKSMVALLEKRKASIADQVRAEEDLDKRLKDIERKDQQILKQAKTKADEIMKIFEKLNNQGHTIIMITHEADIASHAKRIIHIRDGKVEKDEKN